MRGGIIKPTLWFGFNCLMIMDSLLSKLLNIANNYPENSSERRLAEHLLRNMQEIPLLSSEVMAQRCFSSMASLNRFVQALDCTSYAQFKFIFEQNLSKYMPLYYFSEAYKSVESERNVIKLVTDNLSRSIKGIVQAVNGELLETVVRMLFEAENIYLLCDNNLNNCTMDFQKRMLLCGKYILYSTEWLPSKTLPVGGVRIIPRIEQIKSNSQHCSVEIFTERKREEGKKCLWDLHIIILDRTPHFATSQEKLINGSQMAQISLEFILQLISSAYCNMVAFMRRGT